MNLKVPGAILPLGCGILSTRAKTVWGVVATPIQRTRVKISKWTPEIKVWIYQGPEYAF